MKKYAQLIVPNISTERYRRMTQTELRKETLRLYKERCAGKIVINRHLGIPIHFRSNGRKTAYGEGVYSKKAAVVEVLPLLVRVARYNNFGQKKDTDPKNLVGYYNFKAYVIIDGKKDCIRIAVQALNDGAFYYNLEVNKIK